MTSNHEDDQTYKEFQAVVNMSAAALDAFLHTDESRAVGQKKDDGESVGHQEGRRIVAILKKKSDLDEDDYTHMKKVIGYVHRHLKQGGPTDRTKTKDSPWRRSLMNWGHDPLKS